jgi:hypothetical protein
MSLITFTPFSYTGNSNDVGTSTDYITTSNSFDEWREYSNKIASDLDSLSDSVNNINDKFESGVASGELLVWNGTKWDNGNLPAYAITGQTELTTVPEGNDELLVNNGGTLQKVTVENLQKFISPEAITDQTNLTIVDTADSILIYDNDAATLKKTTVSNLLAGAGTGSMSSFVLEDGDGDEVSITDGKEIKFIDGNGININWSDVSSGTDGDPYELTFSLDVDVDTGGGLTHTGTLAGGNLTISHADTSSQASSNNSGRTYIQDITLDEYGHITGISTATETVVNTDTNTNQLTTFELEDGDGTEVTISHAKEVKFVEGGGININWTDTSVGSDSNPYELTFTNDDTGSSQNIFKNVELVTSITSPTWADFGTVISDDNDDTFNLLEGDGIELKVDTTNKAFRISHVPVSAASSVNNSGGTVIQDLTFDTFGHVTGTVSYNLDNVYYTKTAADNRYLNTAGDIVTGVMTFSGGTVKIENYGIGSPTLGGNVLLERPNTTTLGDDIFLGLASNDSLAVYETSGTQRGATLDITKCITSASSSIIISNDATVNGGVEVGAGATIQKMVKISQTDYDALTTKDANTLYVIA